MGLIQLFQVSQQMDAPTITLAELWALYERATKLAVKESSLVTITCQMAWPLRLLGDLPAMSIDLDQSDEYARKRIGQRTRIGTPVTSALVSTELKRVRTVLHWGVKRRKLPYNPLDGYEAKAYRSRDIVLSSSQIRRILAAPIPDAPRAALRALVLCLYDSGCRVMEILGGRWSNLHERESVEVNGELRDINVYTIPGEEEKTDRGRSVLLSDDSIAALRALPRVGDWLIGNPATGDHWNYDTIRGWWHEACGLSGVDRELGRPALFHHTRHSLGTDLSLRRAPLTVIMTALGHTNAATTAKYTHADVQALAAEILPLWAARADDSTRRIGPKPMRPASLTGRQKTHGERKRR